MKKIDRVHKNYLNAFKGGMARWFFNKVVLFVLAAMLGGILYPSNMATKITFCLNLVKCLIVTRKCAIQLFQFTLSDQSFKHMLIIIIDNYSLRSHIPLRSCLVGFRLWSHNVNWNSCKHYHIIFTTISLKWKISVRKRKFVVLASNLLILRK